MTDQNQLPPETEQSDDTDQVETLQKSVVSLRRKLEDQGQRIEALARGREDGMATVAELRAELALVAAERDRLRKQLTDVEGMQTETMTLDERDVGDETDSHQGALPSIDELMATFSAGDNALSASHTTSRFGAGDVDSTGEYQEMISPELIVLGSRKERSPGATERFMVLLEAGNHSKCPLNQDLLTIGRSDSADIQIEGDFISRIHARILRIGMDTVLEDAGSKNGTRVNGDLVDRHVLRHGDLVRVGSANFRFVDTAAGEADPQ